MTAQDITETVAQDGGSRKPRAYPEGCLGTKDSALYIGMSDQFLRESRQEKRRKARKLEHPPPPPYLVLSPKKICYRIVDLDQWLAERLRQPTGVPPTGEQRRRRAR